MARYLDRIDSPEDLKKLEIPELPLLAKEIRERIIDVVSRHGGHLASSLGAVDLAVCLHYVFDSPADRIVWDVGHQAYAHKLLTGRREAFETLRQKGGVSGFPRVSESEHDAFGVGHASTAISAALGLSIARDRRGESHRVIAVLGDGSLTGGLAFEALNNAGARAKGFLVILNDNEMSISPNVGAISEYLSRIITAPVYHRVMADLEYLVRRIPRIGAPMVKTAQRLESGIKSLISPGLLFEEMGFRYIGPSDGHNIHDLVHILRGIKNYPRPVFLHVITRKGKGYEPSEKHPEFFHGATPFDVGSGRPRPSSKPSLSFTEVFGETLTRLARKDSRIMAITAAMAQGTGLVPFAEAFPKRFFDVGIAEAHAVTFAAGLALGGFLPVAAIYSTFLQRAYDGIVHDVCLQNLHVIFALDRSGIAGEDGATHNGVFDLSYLRHIPNMVVMAPRDGRELQAMLRTALEHDGPVTVRYPKGPSGLRETGVLPPPVPLGRAERLREGGDGIILALGSMVEPSLEAAELLAGGGTEVAVVNARFVKPLDGDLLRDLATESKEWITVEENVLEGGFGSAVLEFIVDERLGDVRLDRMGLPDRFLEHGKRGEVLSSCGLNAEGIAERVKKHIEGKAPHGGKGKA